MVTIDDIISKSIPVFFYPENKEENLKRLFNALDAKGIRWAAGVNIIPYRNMNENYFVVRRSFMYYNAYNRSEAVTFEDINFDDAPKAVEAEISISLGEE